MLLKRLFRHARMVHQAEYVKVRMLMGERLADQLIALTFENTVVEPGILPCEGRVAQTRVLD
jgi:hypothetical protein